MTTGNGHPPILDGCAVLPPMEPALGGQTEPKRKPNHGKTGNRFAVLNAFVDTAAGKLTRSEILVWLVLYRDTRNGVAGTSQADIARRAHVTGRTVRRAIRKLEERRLLVLVYRGGLNRGPSRYRVLPGLE